MNDLKELNDVLFNTLARIDGIDVKDENFNLEKERAESIYNIADRIIKNSELALRNEVWQHTRRFNLAPEVKKITLNRAADYDD